MLTNDFTSKDEAQLRPIIPRGGVGASECHLGVGRWGVGSWEERESVCGNGDGGVWGFAVIGGGLGLFPTEQGNSTFSTWIGY